MFNTTDELNNFLIENNYEETTFFTNPDYITALEGIDSDGRLIYDYDKMVYYLLENNIVKDDNDAFDYIDYNTMRTIPYMEIKRPIIIDKKF